jgi:hypothetical protein
MSFRRVGGLALTALSTLLWMSCGQVYRPVVIPVSTTPPNPANFHAVFGISTNVPGNPGTALQIDVSGDSNIGVANLGVNPTHAATLPNNSRVFVASAGSVNSDGTLNLGGVDLVTAFTPATDSTIATGLGNATVFTLPNVGANQSTSIVSISQDPTGLVTVTLSSPLIKAAVNGSILISGVTVSGPNPSGYDGSFTISSVSGTTITYTDSIIGLPAASSGTATVPIPLSCSYQPDFITTTQTTVMYLANFGFENDPDCTIASTDSVASISPSQTNITNVAYLSNLVPPLPTGSHPVALAETADAQNLYVVNEGGNGVNGSVIDLSPVDLSNLTPTPILVGNTPVWAVARADSKRVYVLTQANGQLVAIDTASNAVLPSATNLSVGAGANFILYDANLNRLYVTNPTNGTVYVFSASGGTDLSGTPNDTPALLATIAMDAAESTSAAPCPNGCSPVSVTAMADGSRFYVASYETQSACTDPNVGTSSACIVPRLTVFDARSITVKPIKSSLLSPSLSLLASPQFLSTQFAVPAVSTCAPPPIYTPGATRFRLFTTASTDSSHVYVSICDAGVIADVNATTSSIATGSTNTPDTLMTDLVAPFSAAFVTTGQPPPQNPIFLLTGQ